MMSKDTVYVNGLTARDGMDSKNRGRQERIVKRSGELVRKGLYLRDWNLRYRSIEVWSRISFIILRHRSCCPRGSSLWL